MSKKKLAPKKLMNHVTGAALAKPDDDWKAQDDFHTLIKAQEIHGDAERHGNAMKHAKGQMKKIRSIQDLKRVAEESSNDSE